MASVTWHRNQGRHKACDSQQPSQDRPRAESKQCGIDANERTSMSTTGCVFPCTRNAVDRSTVEGMDKAAPFSLSPRPSLCDRTCTCRSRQWCTRAAARAVETPNAHKSAGVTQTARIRGSAERTCTRSRSCFRASSIACANGMTPCGQTRLSNAQRASESTHDLLAILTGDAYLLSADLFIDKIGLSLLDRNLDIYRDEGRESDQCWQLRASLPRLSGRGCGDPPAYRSDCRRHACEAGTAEQEVPRTSARPTRRILDQDRSINQ